MKWVSLMEVCIEACATLSFSPIDQLICKYTIILSAKKEQLGD